MNQQQILQFLRNMRAEIATRFHAQVEGIFGSIARGDDRPDSDVDVLVRFDDHASLFDLVGLADFLEEHFHRRVDVVSARALRDEIRPRVERDIVRV